MTDELKALADQMRTIAKAWDMPGGGGPVTITLEWADRLDRLRAAKPAVPAGWRLVPVETTPDMLRLGTAAISYDQLPPDDDPGDPDYEEDLARSYRAMLDAAPEPPGEPSEDDVERVAKVMAPQFTKLPWAKIPETHSLCVHRGHLRDAARAAIKAMGR